MCACSGQQSRGHAPVTSTLRWLERSGVSWPSCRRFRCCPRRRALPAPGRTPAMRRGGGGAGARNGKGVCRRPRPLPGGPPDRGVHTRQQHQVLHPPQMDGCAMRATHLPHGSCGLQPVLEVRLDGRHQLLLLRLLQVRLRACECVWVFSRGGRQGCGRVHGRGCGGHTHAASPPA